MTVSPQQLRLQTIGGQFVSTILRGFSPRGFVDSTSRSLPMPLPVTYDKPRLVLQYPSSLLHKSCVVLSFGKLNSEIIKGDEYFGQNSFQIQPG
jgi:hypothetical protein